MTNADPLGGLGKSVQEQDDAMAWLESLATKHGAKAEELVTDPNGRHRRCAGLGRQGKNNRRDSGSFGASSSC